MPAHFIKFLIAVHYILDYYRHFGNELPILIGVNYLALFNNLGEILARVLVKALFAVCFNPFKRCLIFLFIINMKRHSAQNFGFVNPFSTDSQIFLEEICVAERTCDSHGD